MAKEMPTLFYQVDIKTPLKDICQVRFVLSMSKGKIALVRDMHHGENYQLGRVGDDGRGADCYNFAVFCPDGKAVMERRCYHDITGLLLER